MLHFYNTDGGFQVMADSPQAEVRALPHWLAAVVQQFELGQARLVTIDDVQRARPELSRATARRAVSDLIKRGWLAPIDTPGLYEFIPGAAAGRYPSGDPWLALRAELERERIPLHVGANSAAWLLGYAQRSPSPHIVIVRTGYQVSRLIERTYRVIATTPAPATGKVDGLPVPTPSELLVEVAQLAPRLSLDAARGWLTRLTQDTTPSDVIALLRDRRVSTQARAGYIAEVCGAKALADAIEASTSPGRGPFYTGTPGTQAPFSPRWRVYDTGGLSAP